MVWERGRDEDIEEDQGDIIGRNEERREGGLEKAAPIG
jgi:hypothetical protein